MFIRVVSLIVIVHFFLSYQIKAQNDFLLNGFKDPKIRINKNDLSEPSKRNKIQLKKKSLIGEWKVFKNWNECIAVFAENDSIVWVGTPVGLVRWNVFNGTYRTFDEIDGLKYTWINSLVIDKTGKLWIAAKQGLAVYANGTFTHYNYTNSVLPEASMEVVCVDSSNRIIVAFGPPLSGGWFQDGGIGRFDGNSWQFWKYGSSIYWGPTYDMCVYHDTVWIGGGKDIFILTEDSFNSAPGWIYGGAGKFAIDYQNNLWVEAFTRKTLKYSNGTWKVIIDRDLEGIGGLWYDIWNDPRGGLWLSMKDIWWSGYGPYRLDFSLRQQGAYCGTGIKGVCTIPGILGQFYAHHAISATSQFFASIGSANSLPESKSQGGLFWFNGIQWKKFRVPITIYANEVYRLGCSPQGDIFISSPYAFQKTNGIQWDSIGGSGWIKSPIRFKPDGTVWVGGIPTNPSKYVTGLDFDGYGAYWGAYGSIMTYNSSGFKAWLPKDIGMGRPPNYFSPQFMDITVDKNESIWATGWYNGTVMYDRTSWHPYYGNDTILPNGDYDRIFTDSKNRIWFGTNQSSPNYGFSMFDGSKWYTFYSPQRYSISYVYQFAEDNLGNVWLATGGGLLKYDDSEFTVFDSENSPLSLNYTSAVTADLQGNIWIGTRAGLYIFNPSSEVKLGTYSFTSPADSLTVLPDGRFAKIFFKPNSVSQPPVKYQLQRGRGKHKFWTISETDYMTSMPESIEIIDKTDIIGKYFYRIREVSADGKIRNSTEVEFTGGTPEVDLTEFDYIKSGELLFFRWKTEEELFLRRFEIWRRDSVNAEQTLIKIIKPDTSYYKFKFYEIQVDSIRNTSVPKYYDLKAVFSDSSRINLKSIEFLPGEISVPNTFHISQNYPNPFNSSTSFDIEMPNLSMLTMKIYDVLGREVHSSEELLGAGFHRVSKDFSALASGVYFYSVETLGYHVSGKLILLK